MRTTPLQVAVAYAALAVEQIIRPYVVDKVLRADGSTVRQTKPTVVDTLADQASFLAAINEGLRQAVHDDEFGTGHLAAVKAGLIGGKTGTAQVRSSDADATATSFDISGSVTTHGLRLLRPSINRKDRHRGFSGTWRKWW